MAGSLEGPLIKLCRAYRQIEILKDQVESRFPPTKPWPVRTEEHRPGLEYRFYLGDIPDLDPEWGLWAGEILFDLRCALDHLIYELHVRSVRGSATKIEEFERASMFPIAHCPERFAANRIRRLSERDRSIIRNLQPYVRRNDYWKDVRTNLGRLDTLHNVDKHRKLHVITAAQNAAVMMDFPESCGFHSEVPWGAKKSRDQVETWTFISPPPQMKHHRGAFLQVTLEHEGEYALLIPLLEVLERDVRNVLARFADRFPSTLPTDGPAITFTAFYSGWPRSYR